MKSSLGRGLSSLLGDNVETNTESDFQKVSITSVIPNKNQPRKFFDEEQLIELSNSIKEKGILQPIVVRKTEDNQFEIIAGERRWRAAQKANLAQVPVLIKNLDDNEMMEVALIENLQRSDLDPIEEAESFSYVMKKFKKTQAELAKVVGKSRSYIANQLRLLELPQMIQEALKTRKITSGHAKILLTLEAPENAAKKIIDEKMTVRQAEKFVQSLKKGIEMPSAVLSSKDNGQKHPTLDFQKKAASKNNLYVSEHDGDPEVAALASQLRETLKMNVSLKLGQDGGSLTIHFQSMEELDDLVMTLAG